MRVERIGDENGSHIIPALDNRWTDTEQLEWKAAVVELDAGVGVQITPMGRGVYSVIVGRSSSITLPFNETWMYLNGVGVGATQMRRS